MKLRALRALALVVAVTCALSLLGVARADHNGQHEIELGVAIPGNTLSGVQSLEANLGRKLDSVRVFKFWNEEFPNADERALMNGGRDLILSVNAARPGDPINWRAIANAQPGSALHNDMVSWANRIRPHQDKIYLTFQHEPETVGNIVKGNNTDFIAAWRKFMTVMAANGVQPKARVWIMTDYAFHVPASDRRDESKWYPGDSWVEAIAADAYNWHDCRPGIDVPWQTLRANVAPLRAFGAAHPNEQLMLTEIGSAEDENTPGRKAQWMRDMRSLFKEPGYEQFTLIAWFNLYHNGGPSNCDWRFSTGSDVLAAYRDLAQDPFYGGPSDGGGGGGTPAGAVFSGDVDDSGQSAPRWVSKNYTATRSGSHTFRLTWSAGASLRMDLTRNGQWVASDTSNAAPKAMTANLTSGQTYRIAVWSVNGPPVSFDVVLDGATQPPQPPTTGSVIGTGRVDASSATTPRWTSFNYTPTVSGSTTLTMGWTGVGALKFDLRRTNGQWVASDTSNSAPKSMTANLTAGTTYIVGVWSTSQGGDFTVRSSTGGGNQAGQTVMSGTADSSGNAGLRWRSVNWTAPSSGQATLKLDWATASANLRFEVRTAGGAWVASDVSSADPKTLRFNATAGSSYRIAVWSTSGSSTYTVTAS